MNLALVLCPRTGGRYFLLASILTILASAHFGAMADVAWPEQVMFAMEGVRVSRPIDLPDNALRVMRKNTTVLSCLEQGKSPDDIPGTWFVASEIHLRTSNQFNLVVMPRQTSESPSANRCLFHAHSIPFWILIKRLHPRTLTRIRSGCINSTATNTPSRRRRQLRGDDG